MFRTHHNPISPLMTDFQFLPCFGVRNVIYRNTFFSFSVDWTVAGLAAIPYLLFTTINYVDKPYGSGNYLEESAFCALLEKAPHVRVHLDLTIAVANLGCTNLPV